MYFPHAYWSSPYELNTVEDFCTTCEENPNHYGCVNNPVILNVPWWWLLGPNCHYWIWGHSSGPSTGWYWCWWCFYPDRDIFCYETPIGMSGGWFIMSLFMIMFQSIIPKDCLVIRFNSLFGCTVTYQLVYVGPWNSGSWFWQGQYSLIRIS